MSRRTVLAARRATAIMVISIMVIMSASLAPAQAVTPDEMLKDPALETRAREMSRGLRCVVCQNQSIDDSNAPLAHDLRVLLRERLVAGDTDKAAVDYIVARYGNFVLLEPPMQLNTLMLWIGPALVALFAMFSITRFLRANAGAQIEAAAPLRRDEDLRLEELLGEKYVK